MVRPNVITVAGPTATGKSALGIAIGERFGGEIIGADSVQIYRYLDIGSAKPTQEERRRLPHHLIDFMDPADPYTAADFRRDALAAIEGIVDRGRLPIVVGGTALYVRALLRGLCPAPPADSEIREALAQRAATEGWPALHRQLAELDPEAANRIHPNDRVRIERALEVVIATGRPLSDIQSRHAFASSDLASLQIGLDLPRDVLFERIDARVEWMFEQGWVEEVESLLARGYDPGLKPLQAIGYRDVVRLIDGEWSREDAIQRIQRDTRRFAKRQLTWMRKEEDILWCDPRDGLSTDLERRIRDFCTR